MEEKKLFYQYTGLQHVYPYIYKLKSYLLSKRNWKMYFPILISTVFTRVWLFLWPELDCLTVFSVKYLKIVCLIWFFCMNNYQGFIIYAFDCFWTSLSKIIVQFHCVLYSKATSLDGTFLPAWIGYGNAYAAQEEGDQAMSAYRTAARLFPG